MKNPFSHKKHKLHKRDSSIRRARLSVPVCIENWRRSQPFRCSRGESLPLYFCASYGDCFYVPNSGSRKIATKSTNGTNGTKKHQKSNRKRVVCIENWRRSQPFSSSPGESIPLCFLCLLWRLLLCAKLVEQENSHKKHKLHKRDKETSKEQQEACGLYRELASFAAIQVFTG